MLRKFAIVIALLATPLMVARAQLQIDPNNMTPEQQEMMQQMQDMGQQVQQAIQDKGLDPQELFAPMQQAIANGGDPMEAMSQIMIDKGLLSADQLNRLFGTMRSLALSTIRQQLASSDEEWAIIQVKLQRVVVAMSDAEQDQFGRLTGRFIGGTNNSPMEAARKDLAAALKDPNISQERLHIVVGNWRREHEKAKAELEAARADLTRVLTLRQEAVLLTIGVL